LKPLARSGRVGQLALNLSDPRGGPRRPQRLIPFRPRVDRATERDAATGRRVNCDSRCVSLRTPRKRCLDMSLHVDRTRRWRDRDLNPQYFDPGELAKCTFGCETLIRPIDRPLERDHPVANRGLDVAMGDLNVPA
jgi:hypothetical protein